MKREHLDKFVANCTHPPRWPDNWRVACTDCIQDIVNSTLEQAAVTVELNGYLTQDAHAHSIRELKVT